MVAAYAKAHMTGVTGLAEELVNIRRSLGLFARIRPPSLNVKVGSFLATGARMPLKALHVAVRQDMQNVRNRNPLASLDVFAVKRLPAKALRVVA